MLKQANINKQKDNLLPTPIVIAAPASGSGKTTVALGLMGAFKRRGLKVAPFKVGPDYIDPGFHGRAAGAPSRNLDTWLTSPGMVQEIYRRGAAGAEIAIVEGVMGLFDGRAGGGEQGSTAEVANLIGGNLVLVVDCARMARSLAPLLYGFATFDPRLKLAGVILNNVGSPRHAAMLGEAAELAGVPVLGVVPRTQLSLPSRHLGLVPAAEQERLDEVLAAIADHMEQSVDLTALTALGAPGLAEVASGPANTKPLEAARVGVRLAVARDRAFSFYYQDSLEALAAAGARLEFFSPLQDEELPACDGLYFGGGFPEVFAEQLEANAPLRRSLADAIGAGLPTYAECGGLLYLCRGLEVEGRRREMAGALPLEARMTGRRQALGYVEAQARRDNLLLAAGGSIRGHQFHWSSIDWAGDSLAYDCFSARQEEQPDGYCAEGLLASYVHVHFAGNPQAAARFIEFCAQGERRGC